VLEGGFILKSLFIIWIVSFCTVRQKQDPARRPFTWMKVAYPLIWIGVLFYVAAYVVLVVEIPISFNDCGYYGYDQSGYDDIYTCDNTFWILDEISSRMFDVSWLIESIGNIFLVICIVDLGLSFLYVWNRHRKAHNIILSVTASLGVLLFALIIGDFAKKEAWRTSYYNGASDSDYNVSPGYVGFPYSLFQLGSAFIIILWIASLAILGFAIYVFIISRKMTQLRNGAVIYLVIGILFVLRNTWELVYDVVWVLPKNSFGPPISTEVIDPILDAWPTFVILVLIFVLGCRKRDGLWTTEPPTGIFAGAAQSQQQVQQAWPAPQYAAPPEGVVQYYPQGAPQQQQMQPGWQQQQQQHYYQKPDQGQPGLQVVTPDVSGY